jgi:hypothetical protein
MTLQIWPQDTECATLGPQIDRVGMMLIPVLTPGEEGARLGDAEAAKTIVMAGVVRIVEGGHAVITTLESGTLELRFATGEIFHLDEETVTRIA